MKKTELVFIPSPGIGHLAATLEIAKLLTDRDSRFSITVFILKLPSESNYSINTEPDSIRLVTLPPPPVEFSSLTTPSGIFFSDFVKAHTPLVRDAVHELTRSRLVRFAGFVIDMFCTSMIDVADEFGVPSYLFFTSSAAFLGFLLHLQFLHDHQGLDLTEFKDSDVELEVPSYINSVPGKVFPAGIFQKEGGGAETIMSHYRKLRKVKGIMLNTFVELESHAVHSFSGGTMPPVYPVGPILKSQVGTGGAEQDDSSMTITSWLDKQPPLSVVFLCFGSMGSFSGDQIKEIAHGLEHSGHRFLWSLRQPPPEGKTGPPTDYVNHEEVLPEGFLDRITEIGKVIGWSPQAVILAHPAIGGFVCHCGWNSILESIWFGVPIATWPMYAEQQLNAFQIVKDLGLAVEVKMNYHKDGDYVVTAQEFENGLRGLMNMNSEVRNKTKKMQKISRKVISDGGSSYIFLTRFIEDVMANNVPSKGCDGQQCSIKK